MPAKAVPTLHCLIIDDHPVVRGGVRALLEREFKGSEIIDVDALEVALDGLEMNPNLVVLEPVPATDEVGKTVTRIGKGLGCPVVVFTSDGSARLLSESLRAGVKGFVRKDSPPEDLIRAIESALAGDSYVDPALSTLFVDKGEQTLTSRQREILQMLADGMQTETVAQRLELSTETVRTHAKRILAKLDADTRTQAVAIGIRNGLIE